MQFHASDASLHLLRGHQLPIQVSEEPSAQDFDDKHHARHAPAPSIRQWFSDKAYHLLGRHTVPAHVCMLLCLVCLWAGASLRAGEELPVPNSSGNTILDKGVRTHAASSSFYPVSGSSRSLLLLSNEAEKKAISSDSTAQPRGAHAPTTQELESVLQHFESNALNASGFLDVRPAFPKVGDSGEAGRMRAVPYQVISWFPRITYYPGFLSPSQTEHIVKLAMARLRPSDLAYRPGESIPETQEVRTSTGCFLLPEEDRDGVLWEVADKIASVTHLPVENGEAFNVLRYLKGQHYDSHMDSFDPKEYGGQSSQRIATFLMFLRAPEEGGETVFKREGENNTNLNIVDWRGCSDGLGVKVKPQVGDAVLFWSGTPDLKIDPRALHGACPVVKGEKISMARWIHDRPFSPRRGKRHLAAGRH